MIISPTKLMQRLGVSGGLVPFFKCVCVYFVVATDLAPSAAAAAAKCSPVLCLMLFVLLHQPPQHVQDQGRYARRVALGLALSALGDALLVWPQLFEAGMAAFAAAHVAYLAAFGFHPPAWHIAALTQPAAALFPLALSLPGRLALLVPAYAQLLGALAWRGAARGGAAAAGALLFLASDALLAYGMFATPLPYRQVLVMSTYYLAQLGIALSVLALRPGRTHAH